MSAKSLPQVNRTIIYTEPTTIKTEVVEQLVPHPGPGEVLVRLYFSGVCHTDYAFCMGAFPGAPPAQKGQIGEHEGIGEVIAQGPEVETPANGSKVGIKYAADACLSCDKCIRGGETCCSRTQKISGYTVPGTFQQFCVSPARYVSPIPENMDLAATAPLMCSGISVYAALKRVNLLNGEWVLVGGAGGGLGHLALQYAKAFGGRVLAIDSGGKEDLCRGLGADEFLDFQKFGSDEAFARKVRSITDGVARAVLMCASSSKAYAQSLFWLRVRGVLVCLGVPEVPELPGVNLTLMVNLELSIIATKGKPPRSYRMPQHGRKMWD